MWVTISHPTEWALHQDRKCQGLGRYQQHANLLTPGFKKVPDIGNEHIEIHFEGALIGLCLRSHTTVPSAQGTSTWSRMLVSRCWEKATSNVTERAGTRVMTMICPARYIHIVTTKTLMTSAFRKIATLGRPHQTPY